MENYGPIEGASPGTTKSPRTIRKTNKVDDIEGAYTKDFGSIPSNQREKLKQGDYYHFPRNGNRLIVRKSRDEESVLESEEQAKDQRTPFSKGQRTLMLNNHRQSD